MSGECCPRGAFHGHLLVGRALHGERSCLVLEVVGRHLELVGDDLARLLDDLLPRRPERRSADRKASTPVGIETVRRDARIAVQNLDL